MTIKKGGEYAVYYAGKVRRATVTAIIRNEWGSVSVAWKFRYGFLMGWSSEMVHSAAGFRELLGEELASAEV